MLEDLPFNHFVSDDDFYSALSQYWYNDASMNYEKLNNLKFNVFDTNTDSNTKIPNHVHDPDFNCRLYTDVTNELLSSCNYYIEDAFQNAAKLFSPSDLSMCHHNIRSLPAHINEFSAYLKTLNHKFCCIGLSETWLKESNKDLYNIEGYSSIHNVRSDNRGGGVSLFVTQDIKYNVRNDLSDMIEDVCEAVFIEVPSTEICSHKKVIVGEIYRPPHQSVKDFIESFQ